MRRRSEEIRSISLSPALGRPAARGFVLDFVFGRKCLARFAFFRDVLVRLSLVVNAIFELAIALGEQPGDNIQAARDESALPGKVPRLAQS